MGNTEVQALRSPAFQKFAACVRGSAAMPFRRHFWKRTALFLKGARLLATEVIIVAVAVGAIALLVREVWTPVVRISVITVPKDLHDSGFTEAAAAELIRAELERIQKAANTSMERTSFGRDPASLKISIPGTGLGLGDVIQYLKEATGTDDTAINVYLTRNFGMLNVVVRSTNAAVPIARSAFLAGSQTEAIRYAAEQAARASQPYVLASYLCDHDELPSCKMLLKEIHQHFDHGASSRARASNHEGLIFEDAKEFDKAMSAYREALTHDSEAWYAYINQGNLYARLDQHEEAVVAYRKALRVAGANASAYNGLGNAYSKLKNWHKAIRAYRAAIDVDSKLSNSYYGLGIALMELGRSSDAVWAHREFVALEPKSADAFNGLANALWRSGDGAEAIAAYRKAIQLDSANAYPHNGLGNVLSEMGDFDGAIAAYRTAIALNPDDALPRNGLGNVLHKIGNYDEAIVNYRAAIQLDPGSAFPLNGLANTLSKLNRFEEAVSLYEKALAINDPQVPVRQNLAITFAAYCTHLLRNAQREKARVACERAKKLAPENAYVMAVFSHNFPPP